MYMYRKISEYLEKWGRLNFEAPVCKIKCRRSFFRKINRRK